MKIHRATFDHIPQLLELERASPEAAHWTEQHYREALGHGSGGPERLFLVAEHLASPKSEDRSAIIAFLVARHLAPEWELENIVVAASTRQRGIGTQLLRALLDLAREANSTSVFLEVRESNKAARALYEHAGFRQSGRRKSYYVNPQEDAIVYSFSLI